MPARQATTKMQEIKLAHSPDSDDAFMFYALATNRVKVPGLRFTHVLSDIETLNQKARLGEYDLTAISYHAYPYVADKYALMASGATVMSAAALGRNRCMKRVVLTSSGASKGSE